MVGSTSSSALLIALLTGCQLHDFGQLLANTHRLHWSMMTRPSDREITSQRQSQVPSLPILFAAQETNAPADRSHPVLVEIRDRLKDVISSGGENISSIEVESILLRHPAVRKWRLLACRTNAGAKRRTPLSF